eukprot:5511535-Ditylum_brightwellii.AAC.1
MRSDALDGTTPMFVAALAVHKKACAEKEGKENHITDCQEDLRKDRAQQAKRRLDFLLKQSDIFSHFGNVEEDSEKYLANRRTTHSDTEKRDGVSISCCDTNTAVTGNDDTEEFKEGNVHMVMFLALQPSTLGFGQMHAHQLEGLNWMIHIQEHGVNSILAKEMGPGKMLQSLSILVYMMETLQ